MARTTRHVLALLGVACLLAACTTPERTLSTPSAPPATSVVPPPSETTSPPLEVDPPRAASQLPGTLLVRGDDGGMTALRPDATHPVTVVDIADGAMVQQAVWSPDGRWIAWSELAVANGRAEAHVVVSAPDGSGRRESLIPFPPFYLSWDPTSSRVAFLGGEEPFTLGLVERRGDPGARPLAKGVPFYLSWGPTGDRMVTHVGSEGLDELAIDGETTDLGTTSLLQAPSWGPDGQIAFVRPAGGGGRGELVALDERSGRIRPLADLEGAAYLVVSPDGSRVAFHGRDPEEQDFYDRGLPDVATDLGVHVASTDGSREVVATSEPAMAWSWSPDGRRLAVLEPMYGDEIRFRWRIWSDEGSFTTPPFSGSITFLQEAAFFTQYAQSTTMWSPDSSAFAYPAEVDDAGPVILVQPAARDAQPFVVGSGSWVGWSPV